MTILHFKTQEFFDYLESRGCKLYSNDYANMNYVVYEKNGFILPIKIRSHGYYPGYVCLACETLGIEPPEDFKKVKLQLDHLRKQAKNKKK